MINRLYRLEQGSLQENEFQHLLPALQALQQHRHPPGETDDPIEPYPQEFHGRAWRWRQVGSLHKFDGFSIVNDSLLFGKIENYHGGTVELGFGSITYHGQAAQDPHAVFAGVLEARLHWGGRMFAVDGTEEFKLQTWAAARVLDLTITNYAPPHPQFAQGYLDEFHQVYRQGQPQAQRPASQPKYRQSRPTR